MAAVIRVSSCTTPSFMGTLKSTRIITRLPARSTLFTVLITVFSCSCHKNKKPRTAPTTQTTTETFVQFVKSVVNPQPPFCYFRLAM
jgi:hypothetical protein